MYCNKYGRLIGMRIVFYGFMWCIVVIIKSVIFIVNNVLNNSVLV